MTSQNILFLLVSLIGLVASARGDGMDDADYNPMASLLSEYDAIGSTDELAPSYDNDVPVHSIESVGGGASSTASFSFEKPSISTLLAPQVEVFSLIEAFLKLKAEMASRIHLLINDNFDLFHSVYKVIIGKVSKLHSFTLLGISIIRKIFEFAVQMLGVWEINKPSVSFGFNKYHNIG